MLGLFHYLKYSPFDTHGFSELNSQYKHNQSLEEGSRTNSRNIVYIKYI